MSSRAVEMLKEDMDVLGPVRARDVTKAQQETWQWRASWKRTEKSAWEPTAKMSTSFSPALEREEEAAAAAPEIPEAHPFLYVPVAAGPAPGGVALPAGAQAAAEQKSWEETLRQKARAEGEAAAQARYEQHLARVREGLRVALEGFAHERTAYYRQVEGEVVELALAIARKILHREAQVDPLLLAGLVRVALDQIEGDTKVAVGCIRSNWPIRARFLLHTMDAQAVPEVVEDPTVQLDRCVLQTTNWEPAELGIEPQFKEIEQGLLDLVAKRPAGEG